MAFPPAFIDELIARNPIEDVVGQYVQLKRHGSNYFGLCPFHGEKTPSFSVSPNKQMYYCFGCHKGGGVVNFIMDIESLSYPDAVRLLAKRANLEIPEEDRYASRYREQERLWRLCKDAAKFYHTQLKSEQGREARAYLVRRGLDWATVTKFGIGYAPEGWRNLIPAMEKLGYTAEEMIAANLVSVSEKNGKRSVYDRFRSRIMFPLIDLRGNVLGFSGRALDKNDKAKYINPTDTILFSKRKFLFAMNLAKKTKKDYFIVCEGPMDAIACHQFGFDSAVASQGTALTEDQVNMISKYTDNVIMCYDNDKAGQENTRRAITMFEKAGVQVRVLQLHDAKDADEFLHRFGADPFEVLIQGSEGQADFRLRSLMSQVDMNTDDGRIEFSQKAASMISTLPSAVEREIYADKIAGIVGSSKEAVLAEVNKAYKKRLRRDRRAQEKLELDPIAAMQPKSRGLAYRVPRSACAEENLFAQIIQQPELLGLTQTLTGSRFTVPFLGRAFDLLLARYRAGEQVSVSVLEGFSTDEMSQMTRILGNRNYIPSAEAYRDCERVILEEAEKAEQSREKSDEADLLAFRERVKNKKAYGGSNNGTE